MSGFWQRLENVKNAVQDGVREFQQEVQQGVQVLEARGVSTFEGAQFDTSTATENSQIQRDPQVLNIQLDQGAKQQQIVEDQQGGNNNDTNTEDQNEDHNFNYGQQSIAESNSDERFEMVQQIDAQEDIENVQNSTKVDIQEKSNSAIKADQDNVKAKRSLELKMDELVEMVSVLREEKTLLSENLRSKDSKLVQLENERGELRSQVQNLTQLVQQQMQKIQGKITSQEAENEFIIKEKDSLADTVSMLRQDLSACQDQRDVYKTEAEALRKTIQNLQQQLEKSKESVEHQKKEVTSANMLLAERVAELEKIKSDAVSKVELQEYRHRAVSAEEKIEDLVKSSESALKKCQDAEKSMLEMEEAKREAERLRSEAEARANAALTLLEEERLQRTEAQDVTASLKQDSERRARVFNNAVQTAVAKIQSDFQNEREELLGYIEELRDTLRKYENRQDEQSQEMLHAQQHTQQFQIQISQLESEKQSLSTQLATSKVKCEELRIKIHNLEEERAEIESELSSVQPQLQDLQQQCQNAKQEIDDKNQQLQQIQQNFEQEKKSLQAEVEQHRVRAQAAMEALAAKEAAEPPTTAIDINKQREIEHAKTRIQQLEQQIYQMNQQQSQSFFSGLQQGRPEQILTNLGLEKASKLFSGGQLRGGGVVADIESYGKRENLMRQSNKQSKQGEGSKGQISLRTWLLIGYLGLLHLTVMYQYTKQNINLELACEQFTQ